MVQGGCGCEDCGRHVSSWMFLSAKAAVLTHGRRRARVSTHGPSVGVQVSNAHMHAAGKLQPVCHVSCFETGQVFWRGRPLRKSECRRRRLITRFCRPHLALGINIFDASEFHPLLNSIGSSWQVGLLPLLCCLHLDERYALDTWRVAALRAMLPLWVLESKVAGACDLKLLVSTH